MRNQDFDEYLSSHFARLGGKKRISRRVDCLRANYAKLLPVDRSAKILEIGPGMGELLYLLTKELGYTSVQAIDVSREAAEHCSALYCPTSCVADSVDFLEKHQRGLDRIFMLHVLEHVPKSSIVTMLRAARSALRPGGKLIVEVPNMANPIMGLTVRYADFTHETGFTASSLRQALTLGGFSDIEVRPFRIPLTSAGRFAQYVVRNLLELSIKAMTAVYTTEREPVSANIVAIAASNQ